MATARVPSPLPLLPRPDHDDANGLSTPFMVRAGVVGWRSGDPCGRPGPLTPLVYERIQKVSGKETLAVAMPRYVLFPLRTVAVALAMDIAIGYQAQSIDGFNHTACVPFLSRFR